MTHPTPLSPAAQAIMDGLWDANLDGCESIESIRRCQAAAALRAAADQVVPTEMDLPPIAPDLGHFRQHERRLARQRLLTIAAELESAS